jgi:hypothetical protein
VNSIYIHSSKFRPHNPSCLFYYVTTGKWNNEDALVARANADVTTLKSTDLFSNVDFIPIRADQIHKFHRETKNAIEREFIFDKRVVIPEVTGVAQSYLLKARVQ